MANKTKNYKTRRPKSREREFKEDRPTEHKYNDVSWYVKNEAMLRDAASLSFNNPLGNLLEPDKLWSFTSGYLNVKAGRRVPGVCAIDFLPCIGRSEESTSPANLAAQNIYSYVRYMNSGAKNYDQADLMLYLLSMDSIYMFWNWCKRVYGYAMLYSQKNRYYPKALAAADGVNLDDIVSNLADYRLWLNKLAAQISSFCVPATMSYFIRHSWMVSNIYLDGQDAKSQTYMFVPGGFYKYDETGSEFGGQLTLIASVAAKGGDAWKFSDLQAIGKAMLDALAYSEDIGVMSGDILKAYGQERLFKLAPVDPDYRIEPVYNEEVLMQIENSAIVACNRDFSTTESTGLKTWKGMDITQDPNTGYLVWKPDLLPTVFVKKGTIINMRKDEVSPADVMVATRLTACQNGTKFSAVGTEFVFGWRTLRYNQAGNDVISSQWDQVCDLGALDTALGAEVSSGMISQLCEITQFNQHPIVPIFASINNVKYYLGSVGDIANYTVVDAATLEQIHGTAIMSEFNIPQIGSF